MPRDEHRADDHRRRVCDQAKRGDAAREDDEQEEVKAGRRGLRELFQHLGQALGWEEVHEVAPTLEFHLRTVLRLTPNRGQ